MAHWCVVSFPQWNAFSATSCTCTLERMYALTSYSVVPHDAATSCTCTLERMYALTSYSVMPHDAATSCTCTQERMYALTSYSVVPHDAAFCKKKETKKQNKWQYGKTIEFCLLTKFSQSTVNRNRPPTKPFSINRSEHETNQCSPLSPYSPSSYQQLSIVSRSQTPMGYGFARLYSPHTDQSY